MKSAMQELKERLFDVRIKQNPITFDEMNRFIEKEKQQIIISFESGTVDGFDISSENYYKNTFHNEE